ncbi:SDR family oxidoreductase [Luteimonas sp. SJ-92]|uniref:SDR family oxidoreductase n=1 Tax=Luteimonas salinisoli TaxID=2752307 RepID=A0A853JEB6_9GAMM|nr:SDR family oxidoreductase [Luteimonas salinisoli]NZA27195.1 SDR family oxidoreductase [Luteimonas salinisoli]
MSSNQDHHPPRLARRDLLVAAASIVPAVVAGGALAQSAGTGAAPLAVDRHADGKAALVTGSSRGIGAAIARRLARDGFRVTVNYVRSQARAEEVVREIETGGGQAIAVQADVSDADAVRRLFDVGEAAFGGVDVVVANAGVMRLAPFGEMADGDFQHMIGVNMQGSFNTLREAARRVRDGGRIVTLSSSITRLRTATYGPYAATKAAQDIYASVLAKELAGRMISVNAVAPGVVDTPLFTDGKTPQQIEGFVQRTPHRRLGEPEDIANVVSALCGPDGDWINGEVVYANGGIV